MKLFPSFVSAGAAVTLALHPGRTIAEPDTPAGGFSVLAPPRSEQPVSITEETFSLSITEAHHLLHDVPSDPLRYVRLREMLTKGKARLERLIVLRTKSGQRAVSENIYEMHYPAEFQPPQPPVIKPPTDKDKGAPKVEPVFPVACNDPPSLETRNVGDTLELEPVINPDGITIDLNLVPQSVRYVGDRTAGGPHPVKTPIFETSKITTSVLVHDGQPYFLGTLSPTFANAQPGQQKDQRVWLDFLTVNVVRLERGDRLSKEAKGSDGAVALLARAQAMRIVKLDFRETSIIEAVEFLHKQSVELDPEKQGLHFVLKAPPNLLQTKITLSLKDVSLLDAAREVAKCAALIVEPVDSALLLRATGENP